jgi:diguanylate cyclase (GGDEF)-like protein/PAS domain S-box-containing protein
LTERIHSLRRDAALAIGTVLAAVGLVAIAIATTLSQAAFERGAQDRAASSARDYEEKLFAVRREWDGNLMREKTRLEFTRLLEDPVGRWDRLRAYLASLSESPQYAGMALCTAAGRLLFREGPATQCQGSKTGAANHRAAHYHADESGGLLVELDTPIWLGPDGMGVMHLAVPLDHSFLRRHAFPGTELFLEWQGRVVAASTGESGLGRARPGYSGRIDRGGERYEQLNIPFGDDAAAPRLLMQTLVRPPFSIAETMGMAVVMFAALVLSLWLALRGWLARLLPRIGMLGNVARSYAADGTPAPLLGELLRKAAGSRMDELSVVAHAMEDMIAALTLRERQRRDAETLLRESERRFRDVAEFSGEFVWEIDRHQRIVYLSDGAAAVFGRPLTQLIGSPFFDHVPPVGIAPLVEEVRRVARAGEPLRRFEVAILRPDGSRRMLSFSGTPVTGADGSRIGSYRGIAVDVTQQHRDQANLRLAAKVFDNSPQAILITDAAARIVAVNPAFTEITGYSAGEALGEKPGKFSSGRHDKGFYEAMWASLLRDGKWAGELWDRKKSGAVYPKWLTINAVNDPESGVVTHYVGIFSDITEQKENEARIERLAYHDPLTGLPNRYSLHAHLAQSLADARRNGTELAVMFIDLDRFKTINDSLGHDVGDQLLVAMATRIRAVLRESDTVARLGGDEFVVVAAGIAGPPDAAHVAEKIIDEVGATLVLAGHALHVSPSIGISMFPADGHDADSLMKHADGAMYYVKQHGRNSFHFFTADMNAAASERLLLETQLHRALDRQELTLVYQPQVEICTGRIIGAEALLRWRHPDRGDILPEQFIPIAEDTGLIVSLGAWVLEEACRQAMTWGEGAMAPRVAVNVSVHQLRDRHLVQHVAATLARTGLPAERLELEITESAVMENPEAMIDILRALDDLRVRLAIDDFGTGYSSLAYLKRLPGSRLKIDRSFIMDLETDPNDVAITEGIIALARSLGLPVTAEGIESPAQLDMLKKFGCAEGQGFLFSRPLTPEAMRAFLSVAMPVGEEDAALAGRGARLH